jgi:hypothetical protein
LAGFFVVGQQQKQKDDNMFTKRQKLYQDHLFEKSRINAIAKRKRHLDAVLSAPIKLSPQVKTLIRKEQKTEVNYV